MSYKQRKLLLQLSAKYKFKKLKKMIYAGKISKCEGGALISDILAGKPIVYGDK